MKPVRNNNLEGLLKEHPSIAKRARDRAGLAEIATLLLELRHELGLSQQDLARRSGVPKTMISELENTANGGVTLHTLVKLARGLGASLNLTYTLNAESPGVVTASYARCTKRLEKAMADVIGSIRFEAKTAEVAQPEIELAA